jgi:hypothetical protein
MKGGFSLDARVVLEMAQANGMGIIVTNGYGAVAAWAGVPKEHVAGVLSLKSDEG